MDSVGIGELPDAGTYGDEGSNTLGNVAKQIPLKMPTLRSLGLDRLVPMAGAPPGTPLGAIGRMAEASAGKDSVTGRVSDVPEGVSPRRHQRVLAPDRKGGARQ